MEREEQRMSLPKSFFEFLMRKIENVSFAYIIEMTTGCKVFPLRDESVVAEVYEASKSVLDDVRDVDYADKRPNEISNDLERKLREKLKGEIPESKVAGYPDILMERNNKSFYIEVKLAEVEQLNSSFRTFYYEPVELAKVTRDAVHVIVGFVHRRKRIVGFKIVDLSWINVSLKNEFNANNKEIYKREAIVKEYPQTTLF